MTWQLSGQIYFGSRKDQLRINYGSITDQI